MKIYKDEQASGKPNHNQQAEASKILRRMFFVSLKAVSAAFLNILLDEKGSHLVANLCK
jgi:hypothetical protein